MMQFRKTILWICLMFCIFCDAFYRIYKIDDNDKIRGFASNEPTLAIVTEQYMVFGNVDDDFYFTVISKLKLTENLRGNNSLLEFKFITPDTILVCNQVECSICTSSLNRNNTCKTLTLFNITSVNAESADGILFLKIVSEKNNATIYSFKIENDTYKRNGKASDRIMTDLNLTDLDVEEIESLTSFTHGSHIYFVSKVRRQNVRWSKNQTEADYDNMETYISVTQICKSDYSDDIVSRMDQLLSCGSFSHTNRFHSLNVIREAYRDNVKGVAYLSSRGQLFASFQQYPDSSYVCVFDITDIEIEFCRTWNYCRHVPSLCNESPKLLADGLKLHNTDFLIYNHSVLLMCEAKKQHPEGCFKFDIFNMGYKTCIDNPDISFCDKRTSLTEERKFKWAESQNIAYGSLFMDNSKTELYGNLISSARQLYVSKSKKLIKKMDELSHTLYGLPIENIRMVKPWDSKNGIMYVDPWAKNAIYFKDVICNTGLDCSELLHSWNMRCGLCKENKVSDVSSACFEDEKFETYCPPLWQKVDDSQSIVDVGNYYMTRTNFMTTYNGMRRQMQCLSVYYNCTENMNIFHAKRFERFTAISDIEHFSVMKIRIIHVALVLATIAIGYLLFVSIRRVILLILFYRYKQKLRKNQDILNSFSSDNTKHPHWDQLKLCQSLNLNYFIDAEKISLMGELGTGKYGIVFLAKYKEKNKSRIVAVKTIKCEEDDDVINEIQALSSCRHKNIVSFIRWMKVDDELCIVIEHMNGGEVLAFLIDPDKILTVKTIFSYVNQVLDAMIYLSEMRILHRDLAARNCLLNDSYEIIKISDFGLARTMNDNYEYLPQKLREMPFRWMPLEAIIDDKFTVKGDVWSFAVLIWEMFERGKRPYNNINNNMFLEFITRGERLHQPHHCPNELYEIMKECWDKDPDSRPKFKMIRPKIVELYNQLTDENLNTVVKV